MSNLNLALSLTLNHPSVQSVIEIAKEVINNHNVLDTDLLYRLAKRRLKFPRKGLLSIIQLLINKKVLVEGSKYTRDEILNNKYRFHLYRFLTSYLGAHFSSIRKQIITDNRGTLGSSGQLIWHLEMLIKFNYIKKIKIKNYTVFLPYEIDDEIGLLYFVLRDEIYLKIIQLLISNAKLKKSEVHKLINEKRETIYYRINNLIEFNIIESSGDNNSLILNPSKKDDIILIIKANLQNKSQIKKFNYNSKEVKN
jgi:predicted transcriptional regulator